MSNHSLNRSLSTVSVGTVRAQNTDTTDRYNSTVLFYLFSFVFSFLFSFIITVSFCFSCLFLIPFSNLETKQVFFFLFFFFFNFPFFTSTSHSNFLLASNLFPSLILTKTVFPSHLFKFPGICNSGACFKEAKLLDPLCSYSHVPMIVFG